MTAGRNAGKARVCAAALALWLAVCTTCPAQETARRPDIVVIMADDMGYSDLGCYGGEIRTPVLDGLAANGLRFTQFYNAARCVPTRGSLLTGLYPHQAGVGAMVAPGSAPGYRGRLTERCVTLAEVLGKAGYQTFASGKWHVTHYDYTHPERTLHRASWPLQRGFDRFFGTLAGAGSFFSPVSVMRDNTFIDPGAGFYYTDAINSEASRFIEEAREGEPLFLYIAHVAPHWPLHALPEDIAKYEGVYDIGWDEMRQRRRARMIAMGLLDESWPLTPRDRRVPAWDEAADKEWEARRMAVHAAMVDRMDQGIGRVVEALRKTGRLENTLILFLSDNGASDEVIQGTDTRHGLFPQGGTRPDRMPGGPDTYAAIGPHWANASNTPFREFKKWNHEGGVATPLIAHWPAGIAQRGGLHRDPAHVIDLMATAVEIAGADYPAEFEGHAILPMEGISLVPAFKGEPLDRPGAIFFEHMGNRAVRDGRWKLVRMSGRDWELYDMETDRTEMNDLSDEHPEQADRLRQRWEAWADRAFVTR